MADGTALGHLEAVTSEDSTARVLKAVLGKVPVGVALLTPVDDGVDFRYVYANPAHEALKPKVPVLGKTYSQVWPELAAMALPHFREVYETGVSWVAKDAPLEVEIDPGRLETRYYTFELSIVNVDGTRVLLDRSLETTSEVESLQALRESQQRLHSVLENSLDAAYRRDLRTDDYDYMSPAIESMTGFTRDEFTGFSLEEVLERIHPDDVASVTAEFARAFETGRLTVEYRIRGKDGRYVWLADHAVVVRDEAGNPAHVTGVVRDISVQKRYERELTERARYAEALNRINEAVHSTLDLHEIMNRTVVEATKASGLDATAIHIRDDDQWRFAYSYGLPDALADIRLSDEQAPLSMAVVETHQILTIDDVAHDPIANQQLMSRFNIGGLVAVPLTVRGEVIAVLFSGRFGVTSGFSALQVDFMGNVAATLSLALANAKMYQAEHLVAETLQEALLSLPERVPGVAFAHSYHSAAEAARVGGDFYDIFEIEHDKIGVVIGDVAGKGLQAAVMTSLLRNAIRAHAADKESPAAVLSLTNDLVFRHTGIEAFATVFFAVMDRREGSTVYCNAGHTSSVVVRSNGEVLALSANSPIVGAFAEADFHDAEVRLELGELLFLYTDGLTEARHDGDFYGEQRLFDLVATAGDSEPARTVRAVVEDVLAFSGGGLSDDLALLAVKRLGLRSEAPIRQKLDI